MYNNSDSGLKKRKNYYIENSIEEKIKELAALGLNLTDIVEFAVYDLPDDFKVIRQKRKMKSYWLSLETISKIENLAKINNTKFYDILKAAIDRLHNKEINNKKNKVI